MADITLKLENYEKMKATFDKYPHTASREFQSAIKRTVLMVEGAAKREAPVNKSPWVTGGDLRQSIRSRMDGATGVVEVGAKYAVMVHEGTRPHEIRPKTARVLANRRAGLVFGTLVKHPGTKANPFLQRAVDNVSGRITQTFEKAIENVLRFITT